MSVGRYVEVGSRRRRALLAAAAVGALTVSGFVHADGPASASTPAGVASLGPTPTPTLDLPVKRPNMLMITVDDMAYSDLKYLPSVRKLIAQSGVSFSDAITPTPICVPARASLLTGQYAFNHGARTISGPHGGYRSLDESGTVATSLQRAGYKTMMVGKFLNGYGEAGTRRDVPPGWNQWRATIDPSTYNYARPQFNVNGRIVKPGVYSTTEITRQAKTGLSAMRRSGKPWFGWVNYVAPHNGGPQGVGDPGRRFKGTSAALGVPVPAKQDRGHYRGVRIPKRPNLFPANRSQFAPSSPARRSFTSKQKRALRIEYQRRLESLRSVDRNVRSLVASLKSHGELDRTLIIFNSDNGYSTGYHNIDGKLWHYDELLRVPLLMRGPGVPTGRTVGTAVTTPDIGATLLAAGGALPQRVVDGVPILPWLSLPDQVRVIPINGWAVKNGDKQLYSGIRVGPLTYVKLLGGGTEVYDRTTDPYEIHNLAHLPSMSAKVDALAKLDVRYQGCVGKTCPKVMIRAQAHVKGSVWADLNRL